MTIWIFGDSFTEQKYYPKQWMNKVADSLETDIHSLGLPGSSLDYTYHQFNQHRKYIKENDVAIIGLTGIYRRWFYKDNPQDASKNDVTTNIFSIDEKSVKYYRMYLDDNSVPYTYLTNFLYNLNYFTKTNKSRTLIIPIFPEIEGFLKNKESMFPLLNISKGNLVNVSVQEPIKSYRNEFLEKPDPRLNHLCFNNHNILSDKIINFLNGKDIVDLNTGFIKDIFDKNVKRKKTFLKNEFFKFEW